MRYPEANASSARQADPGRPFATAGEVLSLTGLRGLLSLWVVVAHARLFMPDVVGELGPIDTLAAYGDRAVDLFFMLSGLVLGMSSVAASGLALPYRRFVANRVARLFPLHWLMLAVVLAVLALPALAGDQSYDWQHEGLAALANLFLVQNWLTPNLSLNVPAWSASIEWLLYLAFPLLLLPIARLRRGRWIWLALGVVLALAVSLPTLQREVAPLEESWPVYASLATALRGLLPFLAGLLIHRLLRLDDARRYGWLATPAALTLVTLPFLVEDSAWLLLPSAALILALPGAAEPAARFLRSRPLVRLGDLSYALYMLHYVIFAELPDATARALAPLVLDLPWLPAVLTLAALALAVPLAHRAIEVPARRWLRQHLAQPGQAEPRRRLARPSAAPAER